MMLNIFRNLILLFAVTIVGIYCGVQFIPERAKVEYINPKYFYNFTLVIKKYSRKSANYINVESTINQVWNNNVTLHLIFNEFLHNEYRRSFVEAHYKFCDVFKFDKFFGPKIQEYGVKCPLPARTYRFINLTVPMDEFVDVFPYSRARLDIIYTTTITDEVMLKIYLYASFKNKVRTKQN